VSSRVISGQNRRAADWARPVLGFNGFLEGENFSSLILERRLEIIAVSLYSNFSPNSSIDLTVAAAVGKRWMTRDFLRASFYYPFVQLGVRRVGALVAANNTDSLRLTRHAGFTEEGTAREAWADGVDIVCFGMLKKECRFLDGVVPKIWSLYERPEATASRAEIPSEIHGRSQFGMLAVD